MGLLSRDDVRTALAAAPHELPRSEDTRLAAVSAILRRGAHDLELLLIRRAERLHDPWSGHMALPGGRHEDRDRDLVATAIRETREEIGIDLEQSAELLGRLDDQIPGGSREFSQGLIVASFVWCLEEAPDLVPNGIEVDEIHWVPLSPLYTGERDMVYPFQWRDQTMQLPAYRIGDERAERVVWGLTHRILETLFQRLRGVTGERGSRPIDAG
jgi:8-oxo-dGTP pyrophosphatase MutT (NUDIX family)